MVELLIVLLLILLNGGFALSELAVVSARRPRLAAMAKSGRRGAAAALRLAEQPGRFLSTVQIGITLVGILTGAFSGAVLGEAVAEGLIAGGIAPQFAEPLGYGGVIVLITYLSVILGELVPKHVALRNPEGIAAAVAPAMTALSRIAAPAVWLLDASTRAVFRLLGKAAGDRQAVSDEEIRLIVAEAESAGAIESSEKRMIGGVLRLGDRTVRGIMTPRMAIDWLDIAEPPADLLAQLRATPHAVLPVAEHQPDDVIGVIKVQAVLTACLDGAAPDLRGHLVEAPRIPETLDALSVIDVLRAAPLRMALVYDEYGHLEGLVTPSDLLGAIVGVSRAGADGEHPGAVRREGGSWLVAGAMPADELADLLGVELPARRSYQTAAGLVIERLGRLPRTGESVEAFGWHFEVVDLDGRRVDKLLVSRPA